MFNKLENIRSLEVELSTYCNAACPGCARHYWGTSTKLPNLVEQHLSVDTVTKVIEQIPNAKEKLELHLVGNLGDHRIAMCAFILAILTNSKVLIKNFETVFTSSPSFLKIMKSLGAKFEIQKR